MNTKKVLESIPDIDLSFSSGNCLFFGIGGGSDVVTSYGIAKAVSKENNIIPSYGLSVSYKKDYTGFKQIKPNIFQVNNEDITKDSHTSLVMLKKLYNSDKSFSNPYLVARDKNIGDDQTKIDKITNTFNDLKELVKPNIIFTIDTGGDSVTKGLDLDGFGFDITGLKAMKNVNCKVYHIVAGFGSDGETKEEKIIKTLDYYNKKGTLLGKFSLEKAIKQFYDMAKTICRTRTPDIISSAFYSDQDDYSLYKFYRHNTNHQITKKLLTSAFVFKIDDLEF